MSDDDIINMLERIADTLDSLQHEVNTRPAMNGDQAITLLKLALRHVASLMIEERI